MNDWLGVLKVVTGWSLWLKRVGVFSKAVFIGAIVYSVLVGKKNNRVANKITSQIDRLKFFEMHFKENWWNFNKITDQHMMFLKVSNIQKPSRWFKITEDWIVVLSFKETKISTQSVLKLESTFTCRLIYIVASNITHTIMQCLQGTFKNITKKETSNSWSLAVNLLI